MEVNVWLAFLNLFNVSIFSINHFYEQYFFNQNRRMLLPWFHNKKFWKKVTLIYGENMTDFW